MCLLVNLSGLEGHFEEGDYVVEFFNRLLEDVTDHKNAQFDDKFIRNIISRNLRHIAELKVAWRTSTGMAHKSTKHADPHTKPEMHILLKTYRVEELHSRRLGRQIDNRDTDDFAKGIKKLRAGGLANYIKKTLRTRQTKRTPETASTAMEEGNSGGDSDEENPSETSSDSDESGDSDVEDRDIFATRGSMAVINGQLVMDERDMMDGPDAEEMLGPEGRDETDDEADEM